jgi:O-antigen/teichoic acid export membrane protein
VTSSSVDLVSKGRERSVASRFAAGARDNLLGVVSERALGIVLFVSIPLLLPTFALGTYYETMAVLAIATLVAVAGLDVGLVRYTALAMERSEDGLVRRIAWRSLGIATGLGAILSVALWFAADPLASVFGDRSFVGALRVGVLSIPFAAGAYVLVAAHRGLANMRPTVWVIQVVQPVVQLGATLALLTLHRSAASATAGFMVSTIACWSVALLMVRRLPVTTPRSSAIPRGAGAEGLVRFSLPAGGMAMVDTMLLWIDTLLLGVFRPAVDVATYGVVVRLVTLMTGLLFAINQIFAPLVIQLIERHDQDGLRRLLRTGTRWAVMAAAGCTGILAIEGGSILRALHQSSAAGWPALVVLCGAFAISAATGPAGQALTMSGRSGLNLLDGAAALLVNVGLDLLLIPRFGILGAALAWAVAIAGVNVVRLLQVRHLLKVTPFSVSLLKVGAAASVAGAIGLMARQIVSGSGRFESYAAVLIVVSIYVGSYVAALAAMGLPLDDRLFVRGMVPGAARRGDRGARPGRLRSAFLTPRSMAPAVLLVALPAALVAATTPYGPLLIAAAGGLVLLMTLPTATVVYVGLVVSVLFRSFVPTATGVLGYLPDAVIVVTIVRLSASAVLNRTEPFPRVLRPMTLIFVAIVGIVLVSAILANDGARVTLAASRQYLRYPLWGIMILKLPVDARTARTLVAFVLGLSLLQFPLTFHQYTSGGVVPAGLNLQPADLVSGSFGIGGSGVMTVFLIMSAILWSSLALERVLPMWSLAFVAPMLILPMAWGSAAIFVVLLPAAIILLVLRSSFARGRGRKLPALFAGALFVLIALWSGGRLALAPGLGGGQEAATRILNTQYLSHYVGAAAANNPASRVGSLQFAMWADTQGAAQVLLGNGPGSSVITASTGQPANTPLGAFLEEAKTSVWSLQRFLLGFGFVATALFIALLCFPGLRLRKAVPEDPVLRSVVLALPVITAVYVAAGPYSAPWTDPGVSSLFWALVAAAAIAVRARTRADA